MKVYRERYVRQYLVRGFAMTYAEAIEVADRIEESYGDDVWPVKVTPIWSGR